MQGKGVDQWLALICAVAWCLYGYAFWIGFWELRPWHLALCCAFLAYHRFYGCTSFLNRAG